MTQQQNTEQVLTDLANKFADGTDKLPEAIAKSYIIAPSVPCSKWSLSNRVIALLSGTNDARGYRQWQQVGRHVKKGSKAFRILVPRMITTNKDEAEKNEDVEPIKQCVGFATVPVFRLEDTDGTELEEYKPTELPPLYDLAKKLGIEVKYANTMNGEYGHVNVKGKEISLSTESADTFLHELVHYYDLKDRKDVKPGQDKTQEIVAQLGACVLAKMYADFDASRYTWDYIASYAETTDPVKVGKECLKVIKRVGTVIDQIIADAEKL